MEREKIEQTQAQIRTLTEELQEEVRAYRRRRWRSRLGRLRVVAVIGTLNMLVFQRHWDNPVFWLVLVAVLVTGTTIALKPEPPEPKKGAAGPLATSRTPAAIHALVNAYLNGDKDTRIVAERGLKNLLPSLQASERDQMGEEGMGALLDLLRKPRDVDLLIAALKGLEQVGDENAVPVVDDLAKLRPSSRHFLTARMGAGKAMVGLTVTGLPREDWERLQVAIYDCRQYLGPRAEQARLRNQLLRAAGNPVEPSQALLRPAGGAGNTPAEQLLRPTAE
jgi:hypothetical protein